MKSNFILGILTATMILLPSNLKAQEVRLAKGLVGEIIHIGSDCDGYNHSISFKLRNTTSNPMDIAYKFGTIAGNFGTEFDYSSNIPSCGRFVFEQDLTCKNWVRLESEIEFQVAMIAHPQQRRNRDTVMTMAFGIVQRFVDSETAGVPGVKEKYSERTTINIGFPPHPIVPPASCE